MFMFGHPKFKIPSPLFKRMTDRIKALEIMNYFFLLQIYGL